MSWLITPAQLNIAGLILVLAGVLLLFRYGMPYETRRGGHSYLLLEEEDQNQIALERRYARLGWVGLVLVVAGTISQIIGNLV
jgi:hypothetical protein